MKLSIYTRGEGPETRDAKEMGGRIAEEGYEVEYFDLDEDEGGQAVAIYDIYVTPAFTVTKDDGSLVEIWRGDMPSESEVKNFLRI